VLNAIVLIVLIVLIALVPTPTAREIRDRTIIQNKKRSMIARVSHTIIIDICPLKYAFP